MLREGKSSLRRRILIVDDEPNVTEGVRSILRKHFEVTTANSGAHAVAELETNGPFAVVMTDLRMPEMNGIELLIRVRQRYPEAVRLMLSGHADLTSAADAVNSGGVFRFLIKPCRPDALVEALQAGIAEYERQAAERAIALEDALLLIGSRRAFDQALLRVHSHATRYERAYALLMIDVDKFKDYNDRYGHPAGDRVLVNVARVIRSGCRASDEAFRYGGEELIVILPDTAAEGAMVAAERHRHAVEALGVIHEASDYGHVTICLGAAAYNPEEQQPSTVILDRADQALYEAKRHGRNRAERWRAPGEQPL